jgi:Uncharacterized protein conserved in bacteria (DUF2330)
MLGLVLASASLAFAAPAHACACGGLVDQPGGETSVTAETALVVWDGAQETILLRLSTRSDAVDAGLLVPTPTPAIVGLGDEQVFADLSHVTAPRTEERWHLFGPPLLFGSRGADGASAGGPQGGVEVLGSVDLGPLRATTLAATDAGALGTWLREHRYLTSPALTDAVRPYLDEGWSFVAVQLKAVGQALDGDLPPISLRFSSDEAVYPMRMSSIAQETQQPTVYVLAGHRMRRTDPVASGSTRPDVRFAGPVSPAEVTSPLLRQWLATTPFLTATSQWLPEPTQIVTDFTFARAPDDATFQQVLYDDTYFMPGDVGAGLMLALLVLASWLAVRLLRRRPAVEPAAGGPT